MSTTWDTFGDPDYMERRSIAKSTEMQRRHDRAVLGNFLADARRVAHELAEVIQCANGVNVLTGVNPCSEIVSWSRAA